MYTVGDIYIEKLKVLIGFDKDGNVVTSDTTKSWEILEIYGNVIRCKHGEEYKIFMV